MARLDVNPFAGTPALETALRELCLNESSARSAELFQLFLERAKSLPSQASLPSPPYDAPVIKPSESNSRKQDARGDLGAGATSAGQSSPSAAAERPARGETVSDDPSRKPNSDAQAAGKKDPADEKDSSSRTSGALIEDGGSRQTAAAADTPATSAPAPTTPAADASADAVLKTGNSLIQESGGKKRHSAKLGEKEQSTMASEEALGHPHGKNSAGEAEKSGRGMVKDSLKATNPSSELKAEVSDASGALQGAGPAVEGQIGDQASRLGARNAGKNMNRSGAASVRAKEVPGTVSLPVEMAGTAAPAAKSLPVSMLVLPVESSSTLQAGNNSEGGPAGEGTTITGTQAGDWQRQGSTAAVRVSGKIGGAGREANPTMDRVRFVQRVEQAFAALGNRGGSIRLKLSPPELGSLRLEITVRKGVMKARLEAETASAKNLLLENLPALRERLAQQDIKVQQFDVELMDRSPGGSSEQTAPQGDSGGSPGDYRPPRPRLADHAPASAPASGSRRWPGGEGQLNVLV
jgi:flagellar hook-length control protein FliK